MNSVKSLLSVATLVTGIASVALPTMAQATEGSQSRQGNSQRPVTVYFTRHAEKMTTTKVLSDDEGKPLGATSTYELVYSGDTATDSAPGIDDELMPNDPRSSPGDNLDEVCGIDKCAEELSDLGLARAELLAKWFRQRRITRTVDQVISSHKRRTLQTVEQIASDAGTTVLQVPVDGTELQPESTSPSECPTLQAILGANPGDTLVVAGHSGTLYDIMGTGVSNCDLDGNTVQGLGLDTTSDTARVDRTFSQGRGRQGSRLRRRLDGTCLPGRQYPVRLSREPSAEAARRASVAR